MKGFLVINDFEVGPTPWHFSVYKDTIYVPEAKLKIYHWKDQRVSGLIERLSEQEFEDVKNFHYRDIQELELNDAAIGEISDLFRRIEPLIPTMRGIDRCISRLREY